MSMAPFETASTNPLLPATTQPAPGGPGNQATFTGFAPFGCIFTSYSPAFAPISPKDTNDLAESCGELGPQATAAPGKTPPPGAATGEDDRRPPPRHARWRRAPATTDEQAAP